MSVGDLARAEDYPHGIRRYEFDHVQGFAGPLVDLADWLEHIATQVRDAADHWGNDAPGYLLTGRSGIILTAHYPGRSGACVDCGKAVDNGIHRCSSCILERTR